MGGKNIWCTLSDLGGSVLEPAGDSTVRKDHHVGVGRCEGNIYNLVSQWE